MMLLKMRRIKTTCPSSRFDSLCGEHATEHAWAAEAEVRTHSTPAGQAPPDLSSTPDKLFSLFLNFFVKNSAL
jgi:hypothetical protein